MARCTAHLRFQVLLWLVVTAAAVRNYHLELQKINVQPKDVSASDYYELPVLKLVKTGRNTRCIKFDAILKKAINNDLECKIKISQKIGAKYMKAPVFFPKKPCCHFFESNHNVWDCATQNTTLPNVCPIPTGNYNASCKDPNDCELPPFLPPNIPEDFLSEICVYARNRELFCVKIATKLHKIGFLGQTLF